MTILQRQFSPSPYQYREFADEAANWAKAARSDKECALFLQMARTWLEAARALERLTNPRRRSLPR
jgi:hypothetical protein